MLKRALSYIICAAPAAIGIWFVAHYAYTTSDTPLDAYSNAFVFGMIATGAYVCPALAIAIGRRNRTAAAFFWFVALLAIATNWSNTLGAITNRGAGLEAERAKAAREVKAGEGRLAQINAELAKLPVVAVSAEAITAAQAGVKTAEKTREAECLHWRSPKCIQAERDEQAKRDALTRLAESKGASDERARLTAEASEIRKRLAAAPAVREGNSLGTALGRLIPWLDADTASTAQQGLMSLIVELLIAAFLALPELLSAPKRVASKQQGAREVAEPSKPLAIAAPSKPQLVATADTKAGSVPDIMADLLEPAPGHRVEFGEAYLAYADACRQRGEASMTPEQFVDPLERFCSHCGIPTTVRGSRVYLRDFKLAGPAQQKSKRTATKA